MTHRLDSCCSDSSRSWNHNHYQTIHSEALNYPSLRHCKWGKTTTKQAVIINSNVLTKLGTIFTPRDHQISHIVRACFEKRVGWVEHHLYGLWYNRFSPCSSLQSQAIASSYQYFPRSGHPWNHRALSSVKKPVSLMMTTTNEFEIYSGTTCGKGKWSWTKPTVLKKKGNHVWESRLQCNQYTTGSIWCPQSPRNATLAFSEWILRLQHKTFGWDSICS